MGVSTLVHQCPERILGMIGQDYSVSKFNRFHVDISWFLFMILRYIL